MIGCMAVADRMKELEKAAKSGLEEKIRQDDGTAMSEYKKLADGILKCLGESKTDEDGAEGSADSEIMEFEPDGGDEA